MESSKMKIVYTVVTREGGKSYWVRVGVGFYNTDGSLNLKLDAVPVNGTLQVRDYDPTRDGKSRSGGDAAGGTELLRGQA
jgi:hypothetical protein